MTTRAFPPRAQFPATDEDEGLDLREYVRIIVRGWWILLLGLLGMALAAFSFSRVQTPIYEATIKILVQGSRTPGPLSGGDLQSSQQLAESFVELVTTRPVMIEVAELTGLPGPDAVGPKITVQIPRSLLEITARDSDPEAAARIANTTGQVFIDGFQRRQLAQIAQFRATLGTYGLEDDLILIAAQAATMTTFSVAEAALPAVSPVSPRTRFNVILGGIAGLFIAGILLFVKEHLDDKIKSPDELRQLTGITTLGSLPYQKTASDSLLLTRDGDSTGPLTESYKFLQTNLEFAAAEAGSSKTFLITSSGPGDGKSTTAANLAISIAKGGKAVVLVDSDFRRPSLHRLFDLVNGKGLTQVLLGTATLEDALMPTGVPNLRVITAGAIPPDPPTLLRSQRLREIIDQLKEQAEIVLLDSSPLLAVTDPILLASAVDGVLLIVDTASTRREVVSRSAQMLSQANVPVLGAVLNKVKVRGTSGYYYYHYDYYSSQEDGSDDGKVGRPRWFRKHVLSRARAVFSRK